MFQAILHIFLLCLVSVPWVLVFMYLVKKLCPNIGAVLLNPFVKKRELEQIRGSYQVSHKYAQHYKKKYKGIDKGVQQ